MKFGHILIVLTVICCVYSVVILQSSTSSTTIVSPTGASVLISSYYNSLKSGIAGAGVQWITSSKTSSPTRYQSLFYSSCTGSANLTITAANSFYAYLDGAYVGYGSNYSVAYKIPIKFTCGRHNLTIYIYTAAKTNSGLTFSINQDQSNCYNCQATGYWNEEFCQCSCIASPCQCASPKVWKTYPICGCGCPSILFLANTSVQSAPSSILKAAVNSAAIAAAIKVPILYPLCRSPKYYSQQTCSCVCHYRYCPVGQ
jgi:hypothetical protein